MRLTSRLGRPRSRHRASSSPISGLKTSRPRASDESEFVKIALAIIAIIVRAALSRPQQADRLVMADHLGGDFARGSRRADVHVAIPLDLPMMGRCIGLAHGTQAPLSMTWPRPTSALAKDPVCGMSVDPATAKHRADHAGATYYFCSAGCRGKFVADPARFLAEPTHAPASAVHEHAHHAPSAPSPSRCTAGRDLHLPDASGDPPGPSRRLPDLRHGA